MTVKMNWQRTDGAIPTWELITDPMLYVEKWGLGAFALYRGETAVGEPGTYGTRAEAQEAGELEYRRGGALEHARWVAEGYRNELASAGERPDVALAELVRRADAEVAALEAEHEYAAWFLSGQVPARVART